MNIKHLASNSENFVRAFGFCFTALRERTACLTPMPYIPVGDGDKFYMVTFGRPHGRHTSGLNFTIIGMRSEADDSQFAIVGRRRGRGGTDRNGDPSSDTE